MKPTRSFAIRLLAAALTAPLASAASDTPIQARPFGVELGTPGSCDSMRSRLGDPPRSDPQHRDGEFPSYSVADPNAYFPGAIEVSMNCLRGAVRMLHIKVVRTLPNDPELQEVLLLLSQKYVGKGVLDDRGTAYFKAGDSEIRVWVSKKSFLILYAHAGESSPPLPNAADTGRTLQRKAAL